MNSPSSYSAGRGDVEVAGPAVLDLVDLAKGIARQSGSPKCVLGINVGGSALRTDGLLPRGDFVQTATTVEQWPARRAEKKSS
ncbi:hypothetical protein ACLQ3C_11105 [Gordonia sp. DT30]|uniref:hypothetical protein n=1 Tax=unclassified Gordonia (in: high G+C Gram-positive bacteria) TaxID=2657482 RepID=UPI003CEAFF28